MDIIEIRQGTLDIVVSMALELWEDNTYEGLKKEYVRILHSKNETVFLSKIEDSFVGFIHVSVRHDYVEGTSTSPVGYVEGIYVNPNFRGKKVARELVNKGEQWAASKGCKEMASDIEQDNAVSYEFHRNIGFKEVNRLICFVKGID
ncbi:aminoglycoside 6'-N-acetyltransferase [Evansella sp. AB-rgal1]|uniref:aminoglycoside 6'-N-acetyltransferase n=1 Tax=Evansella sp. AB-rgal1 TaxID=3242696 RepID=UPI00359ECFCB